MGKKNTIFLVGAIVLFLAVVNSATQPPLQRVAAEKQETVQSSSSKSSSGASASGKSSASKSTTSKSKTTSKPSSSKSSSSKSSSSKSSSSKSSSSKSSSSSSSKGYSDAYKNDAEYRKNVKDIADAYGTTQKEIDDTIKRIVESKNKR